MKSKKLNTEHRTKKLASFNRKFLLTAILSTGTFVAPTAFAVDTKVDDIIEEAPKLTDNSYLQLAQNTDTKNKAQPPVQKLERVSVRGKKVKNLKEKHDEPVSVSVVSGNTLERELAQDYSAISLSLIHI